MSDNVTPFPGQVDKDAIAYEFLTKILPDVGFYCASIKKKRVAKDIFDDHFVDSVEALWDILKDGSRNGFDVYFCTASFKENTRRIKENVAWQKSFSFDLDFGEGHSNPNYATFEDARGVLREFLVKTGLPLPAIIMSGGGMHTHWLSKELLTREQWQPYANGLKQLCIDRGLHCDHGLTVNPVHLMRCPGTLNYKLRLARPVEAVTLFEVQPSPLPVYQMLKDFSPAAETPNRVDWSPRPAWLPETVTAVEGFPERRQLVDIKTLAENCGVVALFQETGDVVEPGWMRIANLFHYVENGEDLFHAYSAHNYPRYNREEAQKKYDRAAALTGPPRCSGFRDESGEVIRQKCLACPRLDLVVTPIQGLDEEEPEPEQAEGIRKKSPYISWDVTAKGMVKRPTFKNAALAIDGLDLICTHDIFHLKKYVGTQSLDDAKVREVREQIITQYRFDPGKMHIQDALERECERSPYDPVSDYLLSLAWDGKKRIDRWLTDYLGAEETDLHKAFGRKVLLAAVRRVFQPGCKFDYLLILEGPQRAGKSSAWRVLAGDDNFTDAQIKWDDSKQQREVSAGVWIHEIAELVGLRKADQEAVKSFLSRQTDKGRQAYDRFTSSTPRRCIYVGTVNPSVTGYLNDPTGASRFWPVKIGAIDLAGLADNRDQLWAEATQFERAGESLELPRSLYSAAAEAQFARRMDDPWQDILAEVSGDKVSTLQLMQLYIGLDKGRISPLDAARVGNAMRRLGWDGPKSIRIDGKITKGFTR